ncbi:hypothetical protein P3T37_006830 [Kitasatospora sp. MAA4]|uniref:hypothetical protein n=1 Tax=Kitasatospora sp. MAA4 TaxID=3035093 RepID=UPI0024748126|nr:hypothetical protein [Kitasatospora sp. MAA4]MDH6137398.1 hypothetical protein [Kitasatospora sp. MAA4]
MSDQTPTTETPTTETPAAETPAAETPTTETPTAAPRRPRTATVARWAAAVLLLAGSGTAAAFAVTAPARTDLPGLATPNDGRYTFAPLTLPPLPSGRSAPAADPLEHRHYADLRRLLLPPPRGAVTPTLPVAPSSSPSSAPASSPSASSAPAASQPTAHWATCGDFTKLDANPVLLTVIVTENACRAAATQVWTAADGTRTELWLQSFGSEEEADQYFTELTTMGLPKAVPQPMVAPADMALSSLSNAFPRSSGQRGTGGSLPIGRYAYLNAGDVVATVLMTNPVGVADQPFQQVVTLQSDLLN